MKCLAYIEKTWHLSADYVLGNIVEVFWNSTGNNIYFLYIFIEKCYMLRILFAVLLSFLHCLNLLCVIFTLFRGITNSACKKWPKRWLSGKSEYKAQGQMGNCLSETPYCRFIICSWSCSYCYGSVQGIRMWTCGGLEEGCG